MRAKHCWTSTNESVCPPGQWHNQKIWSILENLTAEDFSYWEDIVVCKLFWWCPSYLVKVLCIEIFINIGLKITFKIFFQSEFPQSRTASGNPVNLLKVKIESNLCIHGHLVSAIGKPEQVVYGMIYVINDTNLNFSQPAISFLKFLGASSGIQALSDGFPGQQSSYSWASRLSTRSFFFPQ